MNVFKSLSADESNNTGWLLIEKIFRIANGLLISIIFARYFGPEKYGMISYSISFVALFMVIAGLGLHNIIIKEVINNQSSTSVIDHTIVSKLFAGIICIIFCNYVSYIINEPLVFYFILILSIGYLFKAFDTLNYWFHSKLKSKIPVIIISISLFISMILKLSIVFLGFGIIPISIVFLCEYIFIAIGLIVMYKIQDQPLLFKTHYQFYQVKQLLKKSWPLLLSSFGVLIYYKLDQIMLGKMIDNQAVGIYSAASQLSETWYFIPTAIATSIFPRLIKLKETNENDYNKTIQKSLDLVFIISLGLSIAITILSKPIVILIFGSKFSDSSLILSIHIWASIFIFLRAIFSKWLIVEDLYIFSIVTHAAGAIINIILNLVLIPRMGPTGAAISTLISYSVASYFSLFFSKKTRTFAFMMTKSLLLPFRYIAKINLY